MIERGKIVEVSISPSGSSLLVDAASGASLISVEDAYPFNASGGTLSINDVNYAYTSTDYDLNVITLGTPLTSAAFEGDFVYVVPAGASKWAMIDLADRDEGIRALTGNYTDKLDDGIRDLADQEDVLVSDENGRWEVVAIDEEIPMLLGDYIDPTGLPGGSDGVPPLVSPTATVTSLGWSGGLFIKWPAVANPDPIRYRVFLDSINPPIQQLTETSGLMASASELPDGTDLVPGTTYYVRIQAYEVEDGNGPLGAVSSGTPILVPADAVSQDIMVVNELFTRDGYFGTVNAENIIGEQLEAVLAVVGALTVGGNIRITPEDGIVISTSSGDTIFPADGSDIILSAEVVALALTVMGNLSIRGTNNEISKGAKVVLESGVTNPATQPSVSGSLLSKPAYKGLWSRGFAPHPGVANTWINADSVADGAIVALSESSPGTYDAGSLAFAGDWRLSRDGARTEVRGAFGGLAVVGSDAFILCQVSENVPGTLNLEWYIYRVHWNGPGVHDWSYSARWKYRPDDSGGATSAVLGGNSPYSPGIFAQSGSLWVAQARKDTGVVWLTQFTTAGIMLQRINATYDGSDWAVKRDIQSGWGGAADLGGTAKLWFTFSGLSNAYCVNAGTGAREISNQFPLGTTEPNGLYFDGTRFRSRTPETMQTHSRVINSDLASNAVNVAFTWRKADATGPDFAQFETAKSPEFSTLGLSKRQWIKVTTPPIPNDPTDANDADSVSIYIARGAAPVNADYKLAATPAAGVTSVVIDQIPTATGNPPASNNFGSSTPAAVESVNGDGSPFIELNGDGSWRLGPLRGDSLGALNMSKVEQAGSGVITPVASTNTSIVVTFPVPFDTTPMVVANLVVGGPSNRWYSVNNITTTGFTFTINASTNTPCPFNWIAKA